MRVFATNANPKTFKVLEFSNYAKDDKFVFYQGVKIIGADAKTFEAIDEFYAKVVSDRV